MRSAVQRPATVLLPVPEPRVSKIFAVTEPHNPQAIAGNTILRWACEYLLRRRTKRLGAERKRRSTQATALRSPAGQPHVSDIISGEPVGNQVQNLDMCTVKYIA